MFTKSPVFNGLSQLVSKPQYQTEIESNLTTDAINVFFVPQSQTQKMDLCLVKIEVGRFEKEGVLIVAI